jgi:predicted TPR repeat methyltransferase
MNQISAVRLYTEGAGIYDASVTLMRWVGPNYLSDAVKPLIDQEPEKILDLGIGTGLLSQRLRQHYKNAAIVGLDISKPILEVCRRKNVTDSLAVCDIGRHPLPIKSHAFDLTAACGLLSFFTDLERVVSEMVRVTRSGGCIAFTYRPTEGTQICRQHTADEGRLVYYGHPPNYIRGLFSKLGVEELSHSQPFTGCNFLEPHMYAVAVGRVPKLTS